MQTCHSIRSFLLNALPDTTLCIYQAWDQHKMKLLYYLSLFYVCLFVRLSIPTSFVF